MPYEGEFAHYRPLQRIGESERVKALLRRARVRTKQNRGESPPTVGLSDVRPSDWVPDWVLAVDGSHAEVKIENGFPGAEVSYVTVASVLLDVAKMTRLDAARPVDPREFRTTEQAESIDRALPGCNVVLDDEGSARDSLRRAMLEIFGEVRMAPDGESLLETYEALLEYKPETPEQLCPYEDCLARGRLYRRGLGEYVCHCSHAKPLFSTDALRIHEGMQPAGTNGAMFAEIMQVWERIWVIHILRTLEHKGWLSTLRRLAVVLDGPLAVFGHPAWLSQAIHRELVRLNRAAKVATDGLDLLMLGIEKSGAFVDHLADLDRNVQGGEGAFPSETAVLLTDEYIKKNIIFSDSRKLYGRDTYFGRKIMYKTSSGSLIVATVPFLEEYHREMLTAEPEQFPRLADALSLLEKLVSSRYPNSLSPLVAAHAEAAIPLHLGSQVLEDLARRLMVEEAPY